ncbi:hypothetical protein JX265_002728 [Neoarthrinium moseri]|uniref:Uncharacterized protein n=1 Tax=Neoarthrinium moseri TaxID=1658444 RepID=A0A9Q0AQN6_9PEZI|nr:hypothetical protein JX265_002728 [Neoarthrinium moseri]
MFRQVITVAALLAAAVALPLTENSGSSSAHTRDTNVVLEVESHVLPCVTDSTLNCPKQSQKIKGDVDDGKTKGIILRNDDSEARSFFFYRNSCECVPLKHITIPAKGKAFVALADDFQGRVMRGTEANNLDGASHILGTWMELTNVAATGQGWADVSLIKGCDGAVSVKSLDGSEVKTGFSEWLLDDAPASAYMLKSGGAKVIKHTEELTNINILAAPRDYLASKIGYNKAYLDDHYAERNMGEPVIMSANARFDITFYKGRP